MVQKRFLSEKINKWKICLIFIVIITNKIMMKTIKDKNINDWEAQVISYTDCFQKIFKKFQSTENDQNGKSIWSFKNNTKCAILKMIEKIESQTY